jgi:hypothetical protein
MNGCTCGTAAVLSGYVHAGPLAAACSPACSGERIALVAVAVVKAASAATASSKTIKRLTIRPPFPGRKSRPKPQRGDLGRRSMPQIDLITSEAPFLVGLHKEGADRQVLDALNAGDKKSASRGF